MSGKRVINIELAGRKFPVRVDIDNEEGEEIVRNSVKYLNGKMIQYQQKYKDRDQFDYLAMAALDAACKMLGFRQLPDSNDMLIQLRNIDNQLSVYLNKE
ncbi:MAG: cell division protein ZapA [Bacteroidia bacterium]|nr:cell division protein ZapA [Bacteroidia bacterium]